MSKYSKLAKLSLKLGLATGSLYGGYTIYDHYIVKANINKDFQENIQINLSETPVMMEKM